MEIESSSSLLIVKRDPRVASPPRLLFPNPSDENFELDNLLKIVQRSDKKNSGVDTTTQGPGRRCKLFPGGMYGSYERDARINFRGC